MRKIVFLVVIYLSLLSVIVFSDESTGIAPVSIESDRSKIDEQIKAIYNYLDGMRDGISFAKLETILANKTNIFDVKELRLPYDNVYSKIQNISNIATGLSGLVGTFSFILSSFSTDSNTQELANKVGSISLATMSSGFVVSFINTAFKDKASRDRADKTTRTFIEISAKIAVARKAYDDVENRRTMYDKQLKKIDEILGKIETLHNSYKVEEYNKEGALVLISDISNSLSDLSILIFNTLDEMQNSVSNYQNITRSISEYVIGDMNKLANEYKQLDDNIKEFNDKYRKKLQDKLTALKNLITSISLKTISK